MIFVIRLGHRPPGFHWRWSLVEVVSGVMIELNEIGVVRIRTFPFSSDSAYDFIAYDPVKAKAEAEERTNHKCVLALGPSGYFPSACDSENLIFTGS